MDLCLIQLQSKNAAKHQVKSIPSMHLHQVNRLLRLLPDTNEAMASKWLLELLQLVQLHLCQIYK